MHFLKQYWFGIFIGLIIFWFLVFFMIVAFAPHHDNQSRGFSRCTEEMADEIQNCSQNRFFCTLGAVLSGAGCDVNVIADGLGMWLRGEQSRPWSNYYFTPDLSAPEEDEYLDGQEEYYQAHPDMRETMRRLKEMKGDI